MRNLYFLILLSVLACAAKAQRAPKAVNDVITVYENARISINVLANDSNFNGTDSVCLTNVWGGIAGWDSIRGCSTIVFHPLVPTFTGVDSFYYRACDVQLPTLCDTGKVIVHIVLHPIIALNDTTSQINGDTTTINVLANDSNFNQPDSIRITNIWGAPVGWAIIKDSTKVIVHCTNPNFYGLASFYYRSFDRRLTTLVDTGIITVNVIRKPKAYKDSVLMEHPFATLINVLANDSNLNGLDSSCITQIWGLPAGWATVVSCGVIAYQPDSNNYAVFDTFYYSTCYTNTPLLCDTGMVVVMAKPLVDFTWTEDSPCIAHVVNNSILADSVKWDVQFLTSNGTNEILHNVNQFTLAASTDSDYQARVCLTAYNRAGDTSICYDFWIQCYLNTAIAAIEKNHFKIYPNPASDRIQIDLSGIDQATISDANAIVIYDMIGKELRSIPASEIVNAISVNELSSGVYLIALVDKNQNRKMLSKFEIVR